MKCNMSVRAENKPGSTDEEFRVICAKHGDLDKVRTDDEALTIWEQHQNNVRRGRV